MDRPEAAMRLYAGLFRGSKVTSVERYGPDRLGCRGN